MATNVSPDLVWEVTRSYTSFRSVNRIGGRDVLDRDPLNLTNKAGFKWAGFANKKAMGISPNPKGGVQVVTKKAGSANKPASSLYLVVLGGKSNRKVFKNVANRAARHGYRSDLREAAVSRASAILRSQRKQKPTRQPKPRGKAAKRAAAKEAAAEK